MIYAEVEIEWRGPEAARGMLAAAQHGISAGAEFLAGKIRGNISTQGPPASSGGEYPHMVSRELYNSVRVVTDRNRNTCHVEASAPHADAVEAKRPFIRRTYLESKSELRRVVLQATRQQYGHFRIVQ